MKSQAEACRKVVSPWCVAAREVAKACSGWNSSSTARLNTANLAYASNFEETEEKLAANVASLGFDLRDLIKRKKLSVDYVFIERNQIAETGEYNLEGLFIRLAHAVKAIKAKRVVLDSVEALFSGIADSAILRSELSRLFRWLEDQKLTAIVTGEAGADTLTRHGLEEYVADCVISLDHRVTEQISTRRLRIVKYRGTSHGTDEYPFLIDEDGISVGPHHLSRADS